MSQNPTAPATVGPAPRTVWTEVPSLGVRVHERAWSDVPVGGAGRTRPPVVLVHGLALSSRYWVPLGRRLASLGHEVLAPDLPGFGRTKKAAGERAPGAPDVRAQADHLLAWMDARGVERAVLVGNSVGVQVAVEVAARFPDRVERLVLEGPAPDPQYRTPLRQYLRVLRNMPFEAPSLNPVFQLEYASAGVSRMVQHLRRTVDDPIERRLPDVPAPALVVRGRYDQTLSQEWAERFTSLLPDARLVVVEGGAHDAHYSAPHIVARLVDAFLSGRLDGATAPGSGPAADGIVVPGPQADDPLAPRAPIPAAVHGVVDYVTSALCLTVPRRTGWGPRTRATFTAVGISATAYSLLTDYPAGALRKIPLPVHLNIDSTSGMQLVLAAATLLRGEPLSGRLAVAAFGVFEVLAAATTRIPAGPARLVPTATSSAHR